MRVYLVIHTRLYMQDLFIRKELRVESEKHKQLCLNIF